MSEVGLAVGLPPSLESLRSEGAQRLNPVRFHYMEALSRRLQAAPVDVRPILEGKLDGALADYAARWARQAPEVAGGKAAKWPDLRLAKAACSPLAQLNQHIQHVTTQHAGPKGTDLRLGSGLHDPSEMKSLRRFKESWARIAAEDQLDEAVRRGPQNAGPLNAHLLVLRSLALMRDLSPDYLRRYLSHMDALLWLDQARQPFAATGGKLGRRGRKEK